MTIPAKVRAVLRTGVCYPEDVVSRLSGVPRKPIIAALRRMGEAGAVIKRNDGRVFLAEWAKDEHGFYSMAAAKRREGDMRQTQGRQQVVGNDAAVLQSSSDVHAALVAWR